MKEDTSIFKINKDIQDSNDYIYYGHKKKYDYLDDLLDPCIKKENAIKSDKDVYAKIVKNHDRIKYLVRGDDRKRIYDPNPLVPNNQSHLLKRENETNFIEVNKKVFEYYVNYLRTFNNSWLSKANKENN